MVNAPVATTLNGIELPELLLIVVTGHCSAVIVVQGPVALTNEYCIVIPLICK